jgi:chromosome segregation ATPase
VAARDEAEVKVASRRQATLETQLVAAREVAAEAERREAAALRDAGRAVGERDESRRRVGDVEGQVRTLEARRSTLEKELRETAAALAAARGLAEREAARAAAAERERDALRPRHGGVPGAPPAAVGDPAR